MNCKQGDMAWVVRTTFPGAPAGLEFFTRQMLGIPMRCVRLRPAMLGKWNAGPAWEMERPFPVRLRDGSVVPVHLIEDVLLAPIRNDGEPAELTAPRELNAT